MAIQTTPREDAHIKFDIKDKVNAMHNFRDNMLNKTAQIFEYKNLPESVPQEILETFLQRNGNVFWYKVNDTLYIFTGGLGGEPDVYYRPKYYTIANPALSFSGKAEIDKEGVLMRNDTHMRGLLPLIYKYGSLILEMDISFRSAIIATRDYNAFSAGDDKTRASAEEYQRQIEAGNTAVIAENQLLDGLKRHPSGNDKGTLRELRETYQYIKSLLYSDLGLKTASNMKSQYVSDEENIINDDTLIPLIDNMLWCRQQAVDKVNKMFDLNIEVSLKGTWELQASEIERAIEIMEVPIDVDTTTEETTTIEPEVETEEAQEPNDESEQPETEEVTPDVNIEININTEDVEELNVETEEEDEDDDQTSS